MYLSDNDYCNTEELDLHGFSKVHAMEVIINSYNEASSQGTCSTMKIIHGYGSSGKGGAIKQALRKTLDKNNIAYRTGESLSSNPGYTVVFCENRIPDLETNISRRILKYCKAPKTKSKIAGKFRCFGWPKINGVITMLLNSRCLKENVRGKEKVYEVV